MSFISSVYNTVGSWLGWRNISISRFTTTNEVPQYELNSCEKFDVNLARALYNNTENAYKLGAGFVKPIINADVAFVGSPIVKSDNDKIKENLKRIKVNHQSVHKSEFRDADAFVLIDYDPITKYVYGREIPPESVTNIGIDPVTKEVTSYTIQSIVNYNDDEGNLLSTQSKTIYTKEFTKTVYSDGSRIDEETSNKYGFIPIVHFANEKEPQNLRGKSDIESIEPYLKAYHDIVMQALQSQKLNGNPKLAVKSDDYAQFINANFTSTEISANRINIGGKEFYYEPNGSEVRYITPGSIIGESKVLTEIIFYNIIENSETSEIVFGASIDTSLAGASTQKHVWSQKIKRKQKQNTIPWIEFYTKSLIVLNNAKGNTSSIEYDIEICWDVPDFLDAKDWAEINEKNSRTYSNFKNDKLMSDEEIYNSMISGKIELEQPYEEHVKQVAESGLMEDADANQLGMVVNGEIQEDLKKAV